LSKKKPSIPETPVEKKFIIDLSVKERIIFRGILPERFGYQDGILIEDIEKKVNLNQDELKKINFREVLGPQGEVQSVHWNEKKEVVKNIEFTRLEMELLRKNIDRLDREQSIHRDMMSLAKKIRSTNLE
jgi:uncharacterized membrane protein YgaE (UPF0421/DUF939 family)